MEIYVYVERMRYALGILSRVVKSHTSQPILGQIHFSIDNESTLTATATDLITQVQMHIPLVHSYDGEPCAFTLPAKTIKDLVANLPLEKMCIKIDVNATMAKIICGSSVSEVVTMNPDDFPMAPIAVKPETPLFTEVGKTFARIMQRVVVAAASDDSRPVLRACAFVDNMIVSADGFRLAVHTREVAQQAPVLIPADAMRFAASVAQDDDDVFVSANGNMVDIAFSNIIISTRVIEGKFPEVARVIPALLSSNAVTVKRAELIQTIRVARLFAKTASNIVRIAANQTRMRLTANSKEVGSSEAVIACSAQRDDIAIAVNIDFFADAINSIDDENVTIYIDTPNAPLIVCNDPTYKHVVMPMAVK